MEAQKHFGVLTDGELVARGIEMRRHDTPRFIMEFQRNLILALLSGKNGKQVRTEGYAKARALIFEAIRRILEGDIPVRDLVVSKVLRRPLSSYGRAAVHVSAVIRLAERGKMVQAGEVVDFIHIDSKRHNPLCRVAPVETYDGKDYDRRSTGSS